MIIDNLHLKGSKKAFTLVELVMVIAILAILATIAIPTIFYTIDTANKSSLESDGTTIEMQVKTALNEIETNVQTKYGTTPTDVTTGNVTISMILVTNSTSQNFNKGGKYGLYIDQLGNIEVGEISIDASGNPQVVSVPTTAPKKPADFTGVATWTLLDGTEKITDVGVTT